MLTWLKTLQSSLKGMVSSYWGRVHGLSTCHWNFSCTSQLVHSWILFFLLKTSQVLAQQPHKSLLWFEGWSKNYNRSISLRSIIWDQSNDAARKSAFPFYVFEKKNCIPYLKCANSNHGAREAFPYIFSTLNLFPSLFISMSPFSFPFSWRAKSSFILVHIQHGIS